MTFSCKTRGFCPSCYAKRLEERGEWTRETLLLDVPHRQVVFTIPKTLRIFFKFRRKLLGELCRSAVKTLAVYFEALTGVELVPGIIAAIQTFGDRINFHPHLHLLVTEGGVDRAGMFHRLPRLDDARLAEIFGREVLALLVSKGLLSHEWAERILSWRHTGFNVHSRVRARTGEGLIMSPKPADPCPAKKGISYQSSFLGMLASGTAGLRFQFIVIQVPPEVDEVGRRISFCYHCPDATVRNGRLMPVCLADHNQSSGRAAGDRTSQRGPHRSRLYAPGGNPQYEMV